MRFARSSSWRWRAGRFFPPRLMKNCTMRMPEPMPFGLTRFVAITRAIVSASFAKRPAGGKVETVFTSRTQRRGSRFVGLRAMASSSAGRSGASRVPTTGGPAARSGGSWGAPP
jgi:hypothetical protein